MEALADASIRTPKFCFGDSVVVAKCVKVYDGDTAHFVFVPPIPGSTLGPRRFVCRMSGYNSAEMRGGSAEEKAAAQSAKVALSALILDKIVQLTIGKADKYGRLLVRVDVDGTDVARYMVDNGHGKAYTGYGAKEW